MMLDEILEECIKNGREVEGAIKKITEKARLEKLAWEKEYKKKARKSDKMVAVKRKYNILRKGLCDDRFELIKSIPDFWRTASLNCLREYLTKQDEEIIKYLESVSVSVSAEDGPINKSKRVITFLFNKNPHFKNKCLTMKYSRSDQGIVHEKGTKISWLRKEGTDTITGSEIEIPVKEGRTHSRADICKSFLARFFDPARKDIPGEMLTTIEECLWPHALYYFLNRSQITAVEKGIEPRVLDALKIMEDIQDKLGMIESKKYGECFAVEREFENEARKGQVLIEQKCIELQRPLYQRRNEIFKNFPNFWLLAFLSHYALGDLFSEEDQKIFRFVCSVDIEDEDVISGYTITLFFKKNPYFRNPSLRKRISFSDNGTTNLSAVNIDWKVDMGIATEYQYDIPVTKTMSFLTWFCAPQVFNGGHRYEVFELIKDDLWPNALAYFVNGNESDEEDEQPKML
ncbi:hypothetical protein MKW94_018971 [Papaver nudicaule]|uniref:Uncharacterized protein n=1 Tax=Papaver nudicaule TaxID=74823 RepID=A0AA41W2E4_PAPNU|nr:hypothetical protein [Papaver nudicaule]